EVRKMTDALAARTPDDKPGSPAEIVDPQTGKHLLRIEKGTPYYAVRGFLYNSVTRFGSGSPIVREDDGAWYVEAEAPAPAETTTREKRKSGEKDAPMPQIVD